jgi:omega-6 fatty acid desaturase (delta-12 desaturase)
VTSSTAPAHRDRLRPLQTAALGRSLWELAATAVPFALLWAAVFFCVTRSWWWGVALAPVAAGLLVRLFLIQHDCGHQAFLPDRRANGWLGRLLGVLTMTPFEYWRRTHAIHHATSGDLDRRHLGAIEMRTVAEYRRLSPLARAGYRLYRHPAVMFGLGPAYMFLLQHRLPIGLMREGWAWRSAMGCNLGLAALALPFALTGTLGAFLMTHLAVVVTASTFGVWLFYVQHQYEDTYWARHADWSAAEAALKGSSYLVLPGPLRWLTANIGLHHVHHMASRIPFYRLPDALEDPMFAQSRKLTLGDAFGCLRLALWDEEAARLVSFAAVSRQRSRPAAAP